MDFIFFDGRLIDFYSLLIISKNAFLTQYTWRYVYLLWSVPTLNYCTFFKQLICLKLKKKKNLKFEIMHVFSKQIYSWSWYVRLSRYHAGCNFSSKGTNKLSCGGNHVHRYAWKLLWECVEIDVRFCHENSCKKL